MNRGYYVAIATFLSYHIICGRAIRPDPVEIRNAIMMLMHGTGLTKEQVRLMAIRDFNIIIREDLFPETEEAGQ